MIYLTSAMIFLSIAAICSLGFLAAAYIMTGRK